MVDPQTAAATTPCCVCAAPGGKHCTKCKSRHYCSKKCQLVDWKRGHNKACTLLATEFSDRLLDEFMPKKLKIKEEPPIVADITLADGSKARLSAVCLSAVSATTVVKASAPNGDTPDWRGTCAICLDLLPIEGERRTFYGCCLKSICTDCFNKCVKYDVRCPLCRMPPLKSETEWVRRLQKHVDKGNAEAQVQLGDAYSFGTYVQKKSPKRALQLYKVAAAQGHAIGQFHLGVSYDRGSGAKMDYKIAAHWFRRAAEQGYPQAQYNLGYMFFNGQGVAQSHDEALKWYRLAAAQGHAAALFNLGVSYANGQGVPRDDNEALRLLKCAAAKGNPTAAALVCWMEAHRE